jgi:hypothetical protein
VKRVQPVVIDLGAQKLSDRPEPGPGLKVDSEPPAHPGDVLLVVDSHHVRGAPALGEKGVEHVKRAHIEHTRARELLGDRRQPVAVVASDARRINAGAVETERVKPQRDTPQRRPRLLPPRTDRHHVRDRPLRHRGLGNRLQILRPQRYLLDAKHPNTRRCPSPPHHRRARRLVERQPAHYQ